jgi:hypothetical protein
MSYIFFPNVSKGCPSPLGSMSFINGPKGIVIQVGFLHRKTSVTYLHLTQSELFDMADKFDVNSEYSYINLEPSINFVVQF